ncbi:MAG: gamma-glutamylcyclotransferase [Pseudomonadota bacterium]
MSYFVGFGSLVNTQTHIYRAESPVSVPGWSRAWINNDTYDHAFLSVVPQPGTAILGLLAKVPDGDWTELDVREAGYHRHPLGQSDWVVEPVAGAAQQSSSGVFEDVQMYVHSIGSFASQEKPILYSYLETVLYGFYQIFGTRGVENFVNTTTAWTTIKDDRKLPLYPRHVPPAGDAAKPVDDAIRSLKKSHN